MDFPDEDPTVIKALINGMYRLDYTDDQDITGVAVNPFIFNANIFAVAEKYDIPALKLLAAQKFRSHRSRLTTTSDQEKANEITAFGEAVRIVFSSTPSSEKLLREIALDITMDHVDDLLDSESFCNEVEDAPGFGMKVAVRQKQMSAKAIKPAWKCLRCATKWLAIEKGSYYAYCPGCGNRAAVMS